ncbi:hypothetical protein T05_15897 [Trichinella murrelli]|uniref:Uncharacterized protein n=1 Tax=Trichinella murrelli TaxID=144512 RepID=A0A0V0TAL2_9BILA|nr:hypothetical protein T05_15897 [Trichinella murrelli]
MITSVRCAATERRVFTGNTDEHSANYDLEQLGKSVTISNNKKMLILFCSQPVFIMICVLERVALLPLAYVGSVRNKLKLIVIHSQHGKDI